jgi:hypothetical protein
MYNKKLQDVKNDGHLIDVRLVSSYYIQEMSYYCCKGYPLLIALL